MSLPIITLILIVILFKQYFVKMSPYSRILTQKLLNDLDFVCVPPKIIVRFCLPPLAHEAVLEIAEIRFHHLPVKVDFLTCLDELNVIGVVEQPTSGFVSILQEPLMYFVYVYSVCKGHNQNKNCWNSQEVQKGAAGFQKGMISR